MLKNLYRTCLAASVAFIGTNNANAGVIDYNVTSLGGGTWQYTYIVDASKASQSFDQLTIYFNVDKYASLSLVASPMTWDTIIIQPDTVLWSDGFLDAISLANPIPPGEASAIFSVNFTDLTGAGEPGSQPYELLDSTSMTVLEAGLTERISAVPEPAIYVSLLLGLGLVLSVTTSATKGRTARADAT